MPGISGATHAITFAPVTDRVEDLYLVLPSQAVEALAMAWGPGSIWIDPATSTASRLEPAGLDSTILRFRQYVPLEQWLGDGTSIDVLPNDLWTLDFPAFAKAHPELHPDLERPYTIALPATEFRPFDRVVANVDLDSAKNVARVSLSVSYQTPMMRDTILAHLERKWGSRTSTDSRWTFEKAESVSAIDQQDHIVVYITRPR